MTNPKPAKKKQIRKKTKRKPMRGRYGPTGSETQLPTERQRLFAKHYVRLRGNIREAALAAGYSQANASSCGYAASQSMVVRKLIQDEYASRLGPVDELKNRVLDELRAMAFIEATDIYEVGPNGITVKPSSEWSDDAKKAVASMAQSESQFGTNLKITMHDKKGALELIGKHLKLFTDKVEHTGTVTIDATVQAIRQMTPEERTQKLELLRKKRAELGDDSG